MMRKLFFLVVILIGFGLVFVLAINPLSPIISDEWAFSGIGAGFSFLIVVMIILSLFLPFFVYGIYNQTRQANKNISTMIKLLQKLDDRLQLRESDPFSILYRGNK